MNEDHLYDHVYFSSRKDSRRQIAYTRDAQEVKKRMPFPKSILDIGGGFGEFGKQFDCHYYCYDPFTLGNQLYGDNYDVIMYRGVLQHIYNPVELLFEGKLRLRDGGLLAILATPDTDSIGYLRWGTLPALDPDRNWIPFGHKMLRNILRRLGYKDIEFQYPYGKPYASPFKNVYNFIIGKPDTFPGNMMECFARKE